MLRAKSVRKFCWFVGPGKKKKKKNERDSSNRRRNRWIHYKTAWLRTAAWAALAEVVEPATQLHARANTSAYLTHTSRRCMHCAVHADARTTPLPLPSLVRHPFPLSLRSLSLFLARGLVTHLFLDPLFSSIPRVCLPNSLFHRVFPASSSLCAFLPAAVFPPLSLSLCLFACMHSSLVASRRFLSPFLPRPTTAFISFSESIDLCCNARLSLYFSLCVSLTRCISTSPTNANWKPLLRVSRHNTRVVSSSSRHFPRLSSSPSMGGQGARPRSIFRHPSPEAVRSMIRFEWIIVLSSLFSFLFG